jgi:hypothetical protein
VRPATTHTTNPLHAFSVYRFHFNGGEAINEVYGTDNYVDLGERGVDTRLGRLNWSIDPRAAEYPWQSPYAYYANSPIWQIDFKGEGKDDWVEKENGEIYWDENATSQKTTKKGEKYLGKNVLVATHNRDENLNEPINSARFDLYLESDKTGPSATIYGNTVPADPSKSGTLAEGLYGAKFGHRNKEKYKNELAIRIYNLDGSDGLPTVNGNPSKPNSDLLTGVLFHMGNNNQKSLYDSRGNAYSHGCQTGGNYPGSHADHNAFMKVAGKDFNGSYYLRAKPVIQPVKSFNLILPILTNPVDNTYFVPLFRF